MACSLFVVKNPVPLAVPTVQSYERTAFNSAENIFFPPLLIHSVLATSRRRKDRMDSSQSIMQLVTIEFLRIRLAEKTFLVTDLRMRIDALHKIRPHR